LKKKLRNYRYYNLISINTYAIVSECMQFLNMRDIILVCNIVLLLS